MPTAAVPVFTPMAGCQPTQYRNGLALTVAPVAYAVQQRVQTADVSQSNGAAVPTPVGSYAPAAPPAQQSNTSYFQVTPDRIAFAVTIANGGQHVFRSQGAVAQMSANGQPMAAGPADAAGLSNLMILPQNQQQVIVYGPPLQAVPSNTPITLTLYDIVTATDYAGNPAARHSFNWTFNYQTRSVTVDQLQQQAIPTQTVVQQYDQPAGPTYVVVPGAQQPPEARPRQQSRARPVPAKAPPANAAGSATDSAAPTTAPAVLPKKKRPKN